VGDVGLEHDRLALQIDRDHLVIFQTCAKALGLLLHLLGQFGTL